MTRLLVLALALVGAVACSSLKTHVDWDPTEIVPAQTWQTFAWLEPKNPSVIEQDPVLKRRVHTSVNTYLVERGYVMGPPDQADFLVGFHLSLDTEIQVQQAVEYYGYGYGGWGYNGSYGGYGTGPGAYGATPAPQGWVEETNTTTWKRGTLVLDVVDGKRQHLAWRGIASKRLGDQSRDETEAQARLDVVVHKLLAQFPPKAE